MNLVPSPLHPALVHFPIVLILLGTIVAIVAAATVRWNLRWAAAAILALGAIGAVVAAGTGEEEGEAIDQTPAVSALLEQHAQWAERTEVVAIAAAILAVAAVVGTRWRLARHGLGVVSAVAAIAASVCVFETGHRGGQLVYRHAAGVNLAPPGAVEATKAGADAPRREARRPSDDND